MTLVNWLVEPYFKLLPYDSASLLAGIVWGQKAYLTNENLDLFRQTGLLHLLVLSGENITLLLAFFNPLARLVGFRIRLAIIVVIACFYLVTFSAEPSIVRAALMAVISTGGIFF